MRESLLYGLLLVLLPICCWAEDAGPIRIHLEEGAFINVPNHVDWHTQKGQGWYVKEHYHASGYAFAVCDDQSAGSKAYVRIGQEIPAGTYDLWARHVRMRRGGTNRLKVSLGNGVGDAFKPSGSGEIAWQTKDKPRDYRWAKTSVTTAAPATAVEVVAAAVERTAIGDVPEYPLNTILLDALEITNQLDLAQYLGSGWRSGLLLTPAEIEERRSKRTGRPTSQQQTPVLVPGPAQKGNRVRSGGFESGGQPFWFIWKAETSGYWLSPEDFDAASPREGRYALRLRGCASPYRREGQAWTYGVNLSSEPLKLRPHHRYTFSFSARSDDPAAALKAGVVLGPKGARPRILRWHCTVSPKLSEDWQRFSASFEFHDEENPAQIYFQATGFQGEPDQRFLSKGAVFLDAVQVEEGELTDYAPAAPAEVVLFSDKFRLHYYGEPIAFLARAACRDGRRDVTVEYEFRDLELRVVSEGKWRIPFDGKRGVDRQVSHDLRRRGAYLLTHRLKGIPGSEASLDVGIIDPPKPGSPTSLGIYSGYGPMNLDFFQRAGARYYFTLCDGIFRGYRIAGPSPKGHRTKLPEQEALALVKNNAYVWYDDFIEDIQAHGMKVIPELLYYEMPGWAGGRGGTYLSVWKEHVRKVVSHYSQNKKLNLDTWNTGDEVRTNYYDIHLAAREVIRSVRPDAKVMLSTSGGVLEHFIAKGGSPMMDAVGGSWLSHSKWEYLNIRKLMQDYGVPFWNIGVGWGSNPMDSGPGAVSYNRGRGRFNPVSNLLYCQALVGPQIWCTYTNRYTNGQSYGTNDHRTGMLVPHGVYFVGTVAFLQDARPGGEIELERASGLDAVHFMKGGKTWAVVSPSQAFTGRPRIADGFDLEVDLTPSSVRLYDIDLSPVAPRGRKSIRYRLRPYQLLLLEDVSAGSDALIRAVGQLRATQYRYVTHRFLPNEDTAGLDLAIRMFDLSAPSGKGTFELSSRVPVVKGTSRTVEAKFARGRSQVIRFPLDPMLGPSRPIGNLIAGYTYRMGDQVLFENRPHLWCVTSKGRADLELHKGRADRSDWVSSTLGGYLFLTQRYGGSYHTQQARRGAQRYLFSGPEDASAHIYSRWNGESIRLAIDVQDDSHVPGSDQLLIYFDTDLDGDADSGEFSGDDFEIRLKPDLVSGSCLAALSGKDGSSSVEAWATKQPKGYFVEVEVPWPKLAGFDPKKTKALGLNVVLIDADKRQAGPTEIMLSARPSYQLRDPRGFAQMVLMEVAE